MKRATVVLVALLAMLLAAGPALAGTGGLKFYLKDMQGHVLNGKVTAKKGTTTKTCTTQAGSCTITGMSEGTWTVTSVSNGGKKSPSKTVTVVSGKTVTVNLRLQ